MEAHDATQRMIGDVYLLKAPNPLYEGRDCLELEEDFLLTGIIPTIIKKAKGYGLVHRATK